MMAAALGATASGDLRSESDRSVLRVAISMETLAGSNVNDARVAYRVWLRQLATHYGVTTAEPVADIFVPSEDLLRSIRQGTVDGYGVTALELAEIAGLTDPDSLVLQDYLVDGMEYVLLVHNSSQFRTIADLRGARIISHLHRDMVLLPAWLGTMLATSNLPAPERFFASRKLSDSLTQVVLPVFFRRVEGACLARRNWETALELNPQLGRDLRPLAISPRLIPIAFGFRRTTNPDARKALIESIQRISSLPAGQQIVALYQSSKFAVRSLSVMKSTFELARQYERLTAQPGVTRKGTS